MSARILGGLLASTVLAALPLVSGGGPGSETRLRLAVLPCTNIESTFRKLHPLLVYLKAATGLSVSLVVPADLADFESTTANGRLDFALQDPHTQKGRSRRLPGLCHSEAKSRCDWCVQISCYLLESTRQ